MPCHPTVFKMAISFRLTDLFCPSFPFTFRLPVLLLDERRDVIHEMTDQVTKK